MTRLLIALIRAYQRFLSPLLPPTCRYTPTCSSYFIEALRRKGLLRGTAKGILRILRCNPFFPGGHDPVEPDPEEASGPAPESPGRGPTAPPPAGRTPGAR